MNSDRDAGVDLPDAPVDVEPREVGEAEVEQDHVRRPLGDAADPLVAGAGHVDLVLRGAEDALDLRQDQIRVVVHKQQSAHGAPRRSTRLVLAARAHSIRAGSDDEILPQNSRNRRRVLPSLDPPAILPTRTEWHGVADESPGWKREDQAGPRGTRTARLGPVPETGPDDDKASGSGALARHVAIGLDTAALVCDLRMGRIEHRVN